MTAAGEEGADPSHSEADIHDLVVVGGGMSGFCTAVSAAEAGLRVALVQDRAMFGGSGSSEIRVPVSGSASSNAWSAETGLIHRIALTDRRTNPTSARPTTVHLDLILDDIAEQTAGLTTWRSTLIHQVTTTVGPDGRTHLTAVHGRQLGSERDITLTARQFVDATGDGTLATLAGARSSYGREARDQFGESLAPVVADDSGLGSTITMQARRLDKPVTYTPPPWAIDYSSTDLTFDRSLPKVIGDIVSGFWWVEVNDPFHQIHDNQAIRRQLHRHVFGLWDFLKNHSDKASLLTHHHLEWVGQVPGKRESRRVLGDVVITQSDVVDDARWSDEIGYGGWWIDLHSKGALENLDAPAERENIDRHYRGLARVAPFSIPLRACCAADVDNLWLAGRCLSASHVGLGPIRVQQTLAQLGQAVGLAAARALRSQLSPRELAADPHRVAELQQDLLRHDVRLLNVPHRDPDDLARLASVTAPAAVLVLPETITEWVRLDTPRGQVIPALGDDSVRKVSVRLRQPSGAPGVVAVHAEPLTSIWDRTPGDSRCLGLITVPGGTDAWFDAPSSLEPFNDEPDHPVRLWLEARDLSGQTVEWAMSAHPPTGALVQYRLDAPGGPEPRNVDLDCFHPDEIEIPPYSIWQQVRRCNHLVRLDPPAQPYEADNVTNDWAWPGRGANLWVSPAELPATLELRWDTPRTIGSIHLAFDTDLDLATDSRPGLHVAPQCARDFRVDALGDSGWTTAVRVSDNFLRHRRLELPDVVTGAMRIVVEATHGAAEARIYQVRAYAPGGDH